MTHRAIGIQIEGIGVSGYDGASLWTFGREIPAGVVTIEGQTCIVYSDYLADYPRTSGSDLDPLTGEIRSGAINVVYHLNVTTAQTFLAKAIASSPQATLAQDLLIDDLSVTFTSAVSPGLYHVGEEVIQVGSVISGFTYAVTRGVASTQVLEHQAGTSLYNRPAWWAGRRVRLVQVDLSPSGSVLSTSIRWVGYLTTTPEAVNSTSKLTMSAEDALSTLRRVEVNRTPFAYNTGASWEAYQGTDGRHRVYGTLDPSDFTPRVRKLDGWSSDGQYRAVCAGDTIVVTKGETTVDGLPVLESPTPSEALTRVMGPYYEVAVWSSAYPTITPTKSLPYPLHPLTIAASLLFSTSSDTEDVTRYDVLQGEWSCGVGYLLDASAWDRLILETAHVEVDQLVLGYRGDKVRVWDLITRELLPSYGFALTQSPSGALIPIQIGIADLQDFSSAPQVEVLPGSLEWSSGSGGALDELRATIGALPWREGREVTITGDGVRTQAGSRAMRSVKPRQGEISAPSIAADTAEAYGATTLLSRLLWRYEGIPLVKGQIPESSVGYYLGQWVRLLKPDGLISRILFDRNGDRIDNWDTEALIGQVVSLRYIADKGYYEFSALLTNYIFGEVSKWRAPAARILTRFGTAQYLVSGTSDFDDDSSDALTLTVGDEVFLRNRVFRTKISGTRTVTSITPSGINYLVTLSSDWGTVGVADDWLYLARAEAYSNDQIVTGYEYPYTVMTNSTTITRPVGTTDPDKWS